MSACSRAHVRAGRSFGQGATDAASTAGPRARGKVRVPVHGGHTDAWIDLVGELGEGRHLIRRQRLGGREVERRRAALDGGERDAPGARIDERAEHGNPRRERLAGSGSRGQNGVPARVDEIRRPHLMDPWLCDTRAGERGGDLLRNPIGPWGRAAGPCFAFDHPGNLVGAGVAGEGVEKIWHDSSVPHPCLDAHAAIPTSATMPHQRDHAPPAR